MNDQAIIEKINLLKKERKAVILAHNYQRDEVQAIADHTGDSLGLARLAAKVDAEVIVFCGVHFMAESASILAPEKSDQGRIRPVVVSAAGRLSSAGN